MNNKYVGVWTEKQTEAELPEDYWLPPHKGDKFDIRYVYKNRGHNMLRVHHYREKIPGQVETLELAFFEDPGEGYPYSFVQTNPGAKPFMRYIVLGESAPNSLETYIVEATDAEKVLKPRGERQPSPTKSEELKKVSTRVWDCEKDD